MISIGEYTTTDGESYACEFYPEDNTAQAKGPLPDPNYRGIITTGVKAEVFAESEEEAKINLEKALGKGNWN